MKKFVVLMALLVITGMLWAQAPAAPALTVGALISYFAATDFAAGKEFSDQARFELVFKWVVDDYNTAYLEFEEGTMPYTISSAGVPATIDGRGFATGTSADWANLYDGSVADLLVDKAYFVTDVGKAFKLPIGVKFKFGLEEWNNADSIKVTKSEWEDFLGERDFRTWGGQIEIMPAPMITLRSSWAWNPDASDNSLKNVFLVGAYGTVAPISYEVTYYTNSAANGVNAAGATNPPPNADGEFNQGWLEGGVKFVQDISKDLNIAAAVNAEYDMVDNAAPAWRAQIGAQAMFMKMASLGLAWRGQEDAEAGGLQVQGWAMPIKDKPLELYVTVGLGLDDTLYPEVFDSMEASVKYAFGKVAYYLGFYYAVEGTGGIAKEWLDIDVAGAGKGAATDTTALWIRGVLSL